jgi:hypothetical protein
MLRKIAIAGSAAALLFGAIPAFAGQTANGTGLNGTALNDGSWNGGTWNGVEESGSTLNSRSWHGVDVNGRSVQGTNINGTGQDSAVRPHVIAVELPATTD